MGLLDLSGPLSVFWAAGAYTKNASAPGYNTHLGSVAGGEITTAEGVVLQTMAAVEFAEKEIDTVIVPGAMDVTTMITNVRLTEWLRYFAPRARRVASVCSGAFVLAEAGLLEGRRAVTHWAMCEELSERHKNISVQPDSIFVHDGKIWTSAGVSAGIDLALALVDNDYGRDAAIDIARQLVVYIRRPGGQSQFSGILNAQTAQSTTFDKLHVWLQGNLAKPGLNVEMLASQAGMSPRNFARVYKATTKRTPAKAIEMFRLEASRRLLEETSDPIDKIARSSGFTDEEQMRVVFHRHLAVSPRDYRSRFGANPHTAATLL